MRQFILGAALLCAACGDGDPARKIDGVTPEEAAQLDKAAEMLDETGPVTGNESLPDMPPR